MQKVKDVYFIAPIVPVLSVVSLFLFQVKAADNRIIQEQLEQKVHELFKYFLLFHLERRLRSSR